MGSSINVKRIIIIKKEYHIIALHERKFLNNLGIQKNDALFSHNYGRPCHDNNVHTLGTVWHEKYPSLHYPLFRVWKTTIVEQGS